MNRIVCQYSHRFHFLVGKNISLKHLNLLAKRLQRDARVCLFAAKTMSGMMLYKKTMKEWQDVLDGKVWDLQEVEQQVFQPILLKLL